MNKYKYILLFFLICLIFPEKDSKTIQKEIDSTNKNLDTIKQEIINVENEIKKIITEEYDNETIIKAINKKIKLIEKEIDLLLIQEKNITIKIKKLKNNITIEEDGLEKRKKQFEKRAKYLYKKGRKNLLSKIISSNNWNKRLSNIKYYKIILEKEIIIKEEIEIAIKNLKNENKNLKDEKENKKKSINNKNNEYQNLQREKNRKSDYMKKIANDKKKLKNILESKILMMSQIKNSIIDLINDKKAAKKIENDLAKKRAQQNKSTSGNFAKMKGKLNWPSNGRIINKFGLHTNPILNTQIENLGIDIKTYANEKIYPVIDGVVSIITYNREYGNMIIISHGGGYRTVYANVENITVNENDYIQTNTKIAEVAKSNISNDYLLHFQIWKNESKLNPEDWLK